MRLWVKGGLFLSSYLPLFLIMAIKNWFNLYLLLILIFVSLYSLVWFAIIKISKTNTQESYRVLKTEDKMKESLNYLIPYIISFIGFNLDRWQDWFALIILLTILSVVYINSNLIYVNPLLSFFRYKIYHAEICKPSIGCDETKEEIILLSKKKHIKKNEDIVVKGIDQGIFLEVS